MLGKYSTTEPPPQPFPLFFLSKDRVSLSWPRWPRTCAPPASASRAAGLQNHTTVPSTLKGKGDPHFVTEDTAALWSPGPTAPEPEPSTAAAGWADISALPPGSASQFPGL